ncbi:MAG: hypothetical protein ABIN97_08285 [Ginsengibacter sp.]
MKKILFACMAGCIPALVIINEANAQYSNNITALETGKDVIKMDNPTASEKNNAVSLTGINIKAVKNFKKHYKLVNDEKWYKASDGFSASFNSDGIKNILFYDNKGYWTGSLKIYGEDKMSRAVRDMVKRVYYDYTITIVDEIETLNTKDKPVYIVHLEDNYSIKLIKVRDDDMDVYSEFKKAKNGE